MKTSALLRVSLIAIFFLFSCSPLVIALPMPPGNAKAVPHPAPDIALLEGRVRAKLNEMREAGDIPGINAAFILADGRSGVVSVGLANKEENRPLVPTDRMLAGSIGK